MVCASIGCARRRPLPRLRRRPGSEVLYARVIEPAEPGPCPTLIFGSGLCLEFELLAVARGPECAAGRPGLAGGRADLALSWPARHAGPLRRRAVLCRRADQLDRSHRRPGDRIGAADRLVPPALRRQGRAGRHFDDVVRRPAGRQPLPSVAGRGAARRRHADQPFRPHRGRDLRRGARRHARPRPRTGARRLVARGIGRACRS